MKYCVYYDNKKDSIIDFFPNDIDENLKNKIIKAWGQRINREILKHLSTIEETTAPKIKDDIGHSTSTLHDNIKKLEDLELIETEMIYSQNKQKIIKPKILFVTKNPKSRVRFQKFFQGLFIDTEATEKIVKHLKSNPEKFFTPEEISLGTKIPIDEVELLLNNWDSQVTRTFSDFLKEKPFEKKTLYKAAGK